MTPKRKPAKKRAPIDALGAARKLRADLRLPKSFIDRCLAGKPITRGFIIRALAAHASIIVSDKQGLSDDVYFKRYLSLIEKATRDA